MERRRLGRTGHDSTVAILGGAAFWVATPEEAEVGWATAVEAGVNHLDVAPQYGDAEVRLGPLLEPVRHEWFVACKTLRSDPDGVRAQAEASLRRLRTDHVDLYQAHAVTDLDVLDHRSDAIEAMLGLRDEGLCHWVGITGHDLTAPAAHLEALRRWDLDTVMLPVNPVLWADDGYRADAEALLEHCARRDVGVMAIKAAARRPWGDRDPWATTWYEPQREAGALARGVRFALSVPGVQAVCTPGELALLADVLAAAEALTPMDGAERALAVADAVDAGDEVIFPIAEHGVPVARR